MSAPQPSSAQAIIGVAALAAGAAAAIYIKPDQIIDYTINKASGVYTSLVYGVDESVSGRPRGFFEKGMRGASKFIDKSALALQWKAKQMEFDDNSPIKAETIVTIAIGITTMLLTKRVIGIAMR